MGDQALSAAVDPDLSPHIARAQEALLDLWAEIVAKGIDPGCAYGMVSGLAVQVVLSLDRVTGGRA